MTALLENPPVTAQCDLAALIHSLLKDSGVAAIHIVGTPGSGKTALIDETLRRLKGHLRIAVAICHPAAGRDSQILMRHGGIVLPCSQPNADAQAIFELIRTIDLANLDLLLIESTGPDDRDIGQSARVALFSATGGDDKAEEYPTRVKNASVVMLGKTDLLPHVRFDTETFRADVARINPGAPLIEFSLPEQQGLDLWIDWLTRRAIQAQAERQSVSAFNPPADWWVG